MTETPPSDPAWFAVRCLFSCGWLSREQGEPLFEERITLWRASSIAEAVTRAEEEARTYAAAIDDAPDSYLGLAQAFALDGGPGDGAEVFSLLRGSDLPPEEYLDTFFDTGSERSREL